MLGPDTQGRLIAKALKSLRSTDLFASHFLVIVEIGIVAPRAHTLLAKSLNIQIDIWRSLSREATEWRK